MRLPAPRPRAIITGGEGFVKMGMGGHMKTKAFTLIELLVVIAIIAILMAIIMPASIWPRNMRARPSV